MKQKLEVKIVNLVKESIKAQQGGELSSFLHDTYWLCLMDDIGKLINKIKEEGVLTFNGEEYLIIHGNVLRKTGSGAYQTISGPESSMVLEEIERIKNDPDSKIYNEAGKIK